MRLAPLLAVSLLLVPAPVEACSFDERTAENPTGWVGCARYGEGTASMWAGPGVAVNSCVFPWTACTTIAVQSLTTGLTIIVTPSMFCGCWVNGSGPNGETERLVDLDPAAVAALGLHVEEGLWRVRVDPMYVLPVREGLPDQLPNTSLKGWPGGYNGQDGGVSADPDTIRGGPGLELTPRAGAAPRHEGRS